MSLLVVGSLHLDVVLRAPHLPRLDETVTGSAVDYVFGGKGGNQALAAARLGADVHFAGRAGSDGFGDMIRDALAASGIDLSLLQRDAGPSGMSAAILTATGDYGAVIVSAANLNIDPEDIVIPQGTSIIILQNEIPETVNAVVAQRAKTAGAQVWLNAAPARPLPEALIKIVDLLIVNRVEAAFYDGQVPPSKLLTTLGAEGVSYAGEQTAGHMVDVISTHGAGDMFVGALAARVLRGAEMTESIRFAQAAAALHVASDVKMRAEITAEQVERFMAQSSR